MAMDSVTINRAPVLTLWAAVVAGLSAFSKGRALGIFKPTPQDVRAKRAEQAKASQVLQVELLHRPVPVVQTSEGLRALSTDNPIMPVSVEKYLASKFKEALGPVSEAMAELADSRDPEELAAEAYRL